MDIEDSLDSDSIPEGAACDFTDKFLMVGDKKYIKSSVVTVMLNSKWARKVTIRTLHACRVTLEDLHHPTDNWNSADLVDSHIIKRVDLAACLVGSGDIICLANN